MVWKRQNELQAKDPLLSRYHNGAKRVASLETVLISNVLHPFRANYSFILIYKIIQLFIKKTIKTLAKKKNIWTFKMWDRTEYYLGDHCHLLQYSIESIMAPPPP